MGPSSTPRPRIPGLGCMRLSTSPERDEGHAARVIHAALDAGVVWLDTAHAYGLGEEETGHNERLVAKALASWSGARAHVRIATKGGMARPGGRWVPDGRARSLQAGAEASARALGVDRLAAFLLHAPDPRTPLATSVRALARIQREGLAERIGLCNVRVHEIREALDLAEVSIVQVGLSPWDDEPLRNGVLELCAERGITLMAHTPLGGVARAPRLERDETLSRVAARHGVTAAEAALAWLMGLGPEVVPLPGATRPDTARSAGTAARLRLDPEERAALGARLGWAGEAGVGPPVTGAAPATPPATRATPVEVVLVMGMPAAGKSTLARALVDEGYRRLNRDERGGRLRDLLPELERVLAEGPPGVVLDNTYGSRAERQRVVAVAHAAGASVRCVRLDTSLHEAQVNAVLRMLARHDRLLEPDEIARVSRRDPAVLGPGALFRFQRVFEPPVPEEGFRALEVLPFRRRWEGERGGRALIVEYDGVVRRSRSGARTPTGPDDVLVPPEAGPALRAWAARGYRLLGTAWHPEVAAGASGPDQVASVMRRTHELLGVELEWAACTHAPGPPVCWCRKPLPGLVVRWIERHRLEPARCILVGPSAADRTLAERLGIPFLEPSALLADERHGLAPHRPDP